MAYYVCKLFIAVRYLSHFRGTHIGVAIHFPLEGALKLKRKEQSGPCFLCYDSSERHLSVNPTVNTQNVEIN